MGTTAVAIEGGFSCTLLHYYDYVINMHDRRLGLCEYLSLPPQPYDGNQRC